MSQRRSAPTSCGASTRSGTSLMPGSTVNGLPPKYVSTMASSVCCTVGTTLEMATPRISCWVMPRVARMVRMNTPYSSAVCSRRVVRRQDTRSRESWHTPIFVLVLPTSMSSSMISLRGDFARDDANHRAVVHPDHEGAVGGQIHGQPLASVAGMDPATYAPGALEPGRPERGGDGRPKNHRHQEAPAGPVEPDAPAPSPARTLVGGGHHGPLGGAGCRAPGRLDLRGIERGESMDGVAEGLRGGGPDHARPARLWVSLASICCCSPRRARSRATTSAGARSTKSGRDSLPS